MVCLTSDINKKSANSTYSHFWGIAKRLSTQIRKSAHACEALPNCSCTRSYFLAIFRNVLAISKHLLQYVFFKLLSLFSLFFLCDKCNDFYHKKTNKN